MARKRSRVSVGRTGCLFWLFILLVIAVIFIFRGKGDIKEPLSFLKNLPKRRQTETSGKPGGEAPVGKSAGAPARDAAAQPDRGKAAGKPGKSPVPAGGDTGPEDSKPAVREGGNAAGRADARTEKPAAPADRNRQASGRPSGVAAPKGEIKVKTRSSSLFFVRIDNEDGSARPVAVERPVDYRDSPITRTVEALLAGPTEAERRKGLVSLIPEGTRLISARLESGHLTLNFTHHFEENYTGREAILLELSQVVLTTLDFEQVSKVTILIDGARKTYITGEGVPLKEYYTKQDLPSLGPGE